MIYAKESESMARIFLGDNLYDDIAEKVKIVGGKGHKYYEEWRSLPSDSPMRETIAKESREYYNLIRSSINGN